MANQYVIPPGTEHTWTPPDQVVVSPPRDDVAVGDAIHGLRVQGLVRNQNQERVIALSDQLGSIWKNFTDKKINSNQLSEQVGNFRNTELENLDGIDEITVQNFEQVIIKMLTESTR